MKITALSTGLEVAVKNYKDYSGNIVAYRAIVIDPAYWTKHTVYGKAPEVRRGRATNRSGLRMMTESGIPVARLLFDNKWDVEFVAPNAIVSPWADYLESRAAAEAATAERRARELAEHEQVGEAIEAIRTALAELGTPHASLWRKDNGVFLAASAAETVAAALTALTILTAAARDRVPV